MLGSGTFRVLYQHNGAGPAPPEMGMWQFAMSPVMSCRWHASPLYQIIRVIDVWNELHALIGLVLKNHTIAKSLL